MNDHAIRRSMGGEILPAERRKVRETRSGCPDLWLSPGKL